MERQLLILNFFNVVCSVSYKICTIKLVQYYLKLWPSLVLVFSENTLIVLPYFRQSNLLPFYYSLSTLLWLLYVFLISYIFYLRDFFHSWGLCFRSTLFFAKNLNAFVWFSMSPYFLQSFLWSLIVWVSSSVLLFFNLPFVNFRSSCLSLWSLIIVPCF